MARAIRYATCFDVYAFVVSLSARARASLQTLQPGVMGGQAGGVAVARLSSISSQDSGFVSQDTLHIMKPGTPPLEFRRKVEHFCIDALRSSHDCIFYYFLIAATVLHVYL